MPNMLDRSSRLDRAMVRGAFYRARLSMTSTRDARRDILARPFDATAM